MNTLYRVVNRFGICFLNVLVVSMVVSCSWNKSQTSELSSSDLQCEGVLVVCTDYFGADGDTSDAQFTQSVDALSETCRSSVKALFDSGSVPKGVIECHNYLKENGIYLK